MQSNAIIDNLQNIGYIINALAVLNYELDTTTADLVTEPGHPGISTCAAELLPDSDGNDPCPDLDESLKTMICLCRAVQPSNVPQISGLANTIMEHIQERDENWYGDEQKIRSGPVTTRLVPHAVPHRAGRAGGPDVGAVPTSRRCCRCGGSGRTVSPLAPKSAADPVAASSRSTYDTRDDFVGMDMHGEWVRADRHDTREAVLEPREYGYAKDGARSEELPRSEGHAVKGKEAASQAFREGLQRCRAHEGRRRRKKESLEERKTWDRRNRELD
ncbi:hypothetical protein DL769_002407 [Monosporascus sp. CRB-8-3]|nr:hypothetical protein DL769_002407 [Monosporascus sp. CRB-8-3]